MPGYVPFRCPRCGCNLGRLQARVAEAQSEYPNAFTPWTKADDEKLKVMYTSGASVDVIAEELGRQDTAILKRIDKRQLSIQVGKPATKGDAQAGKPCPGPADEAWVAYSGMEQDDDLLRPHPFKAERPLSDGTQPTRCATCTYDPAKTYVQPSTKKKSRRTK